MLCPHSSVMLAGQPESKCYMFIVFNSVRETLFHMTFWGWLANVGKQEEQEDSG